MNRFFLFRPIETNFRPIAALCKFFIMSMEFDKNISDWSHSCTDHKNGIDFFMRLVKWPKIDIKKCQNLIFKVDFQYQKSSESFWKMSVYKRMFFYYWYLLITFRGRFTLCMRAFIGRVKPSIYFNLPVSSQSLKLLRPDVIPWICAYILSYFSYPWTKYSILNQKEMLEKLH